MKLVTIYYSEELDKIILISATWHGRMQINHDVKLLTVETNPNYVKKVLIKHKYQLIGAFYEN